MMRRISRSLIYTERKYSFANRQVSNGFHTAIGSVRFLSENFTVLDRLTRFKPAFTEGDEEEEKEDGDLEMEEEDENEPDPRLRLGKRLLSLGRVYYKHIEPYPEWFIEKQYDITRHRTPSQIRRCLKTWMIKVDRNMLQKYKNKPLIWGEKLPMEQREKDPSIHAYGPEETISYSFYFMPSRFSITVRLMKELQQISSGFQPKRIVDFGCGPATAAAAAYTVWPDEVDKYTGIDMSQSMLDAGKIMVKGIIPTSVFWDKISEVVKRAALAAAQAEQEVLLSNSKSKSKSKSKSNGKSKSESNDNQHSMLSGQTIPNERFDLAVLSYTLSEMPNDLTRRAAVQVMFEMLDVGGYLMIIEPGNPYGSHTVRTARQLILDTFNHLDNDGVTNPRNSSTTHTSKKPSASDPSKEKDTRRHNSDAPAPSMVLPAPFGSTHEELGAYVVAPCTHDRPCPLTTGTWCSFSQKVYSGMIRKGSDEKFSYVVIQKRVKTSADKAKASKQKTTKKSGAGSNSSGSGKMSDMSINNWTLPAEEIELRHRQYEMSRQALRERVDAQVDTETNATSQSSESPSLSAYTDEVPPPTPLKVLEKFIGVNDTQLPRLLDQLIDDVDWEDYNPPLHREEWGRIVRAPIKAKGHVTMDLCMPSGQISRTVLSRSNIVSVPSLYSSLRKTSWGGLFPVLPEDDVDAQVRSPLMIKAKGLGAKRWQEGKGGGGTNKLDTSGGGPDRGDVAHSRDSRNTGDRGGTDEGSNFRSARYTNAIARTRDGKDLLRGDSGDSGSNGSSSSSSVGDRARGRVSGRSLRAAAISRQISRSREGKDRDKDRHIS